MSDAFTQAVAPGTASPFDGLSTQALPGPSNLPPETIDRTARMATLALSPANELLNNYQGLVKQYSDNIAQFGDDAVRTQAATKQQSDSISAIAQTSAQFAQIDPSNPVSQGAAAAAQQQMDTDISGRKEYALEQMAFENIQNLAASGNYTQAKIMMNQITNGDPEEVIKDINVKRAIIAREVEKANVTVQDQPWFKSAADFVASTVGDLTTRSSFDRGGNVDIDKSMTHWWDWLISGNRQRAEAAGLWSIKDNGEFAKTLRETVIPRIQQHTSAFGYSNHSEALNLLTGLQNTPSPWQTNLQDAVGIAGTLSMLPISKAVTLPAMMIRAGAKREAAQAIADTTLDAITRGTKLAQEASGISTDEVLSNITPTAVNPDTNPIDTVPLTGDALAGIQRGQALISELPNIVQSGRMSQAEFQSAIASAQKAGLEEIGRPLKDFTYSPRKLSDGSTVTQYEMTFGKKSGGGYISADGAMDVAKRLGMSSAEPIQDDAGQWYVKETRIMPESGFYNTQLEPGLEKTGLLGRYTLGARQVGDDILQEFDRASANAKNKTVKVFRDQYQEALNGVQGAEKGYLENVMAWGNNNSTWLNNDQIDELFARQGSTKAPSDKVYAAYQAARDVNDIEFAMRNDVEWKAGVTRGMETASFQHPMVTVNRENAIINRSPSIRPQGRVFDASTGIHYNTAKNPLSDVRFKEMGDDGYTLVTLQKERTLNDGTTIKHFLVKKQDLMSEALRRDQLPYRAGGHRMYADKYFVKQADVGVQKDTGEKFLKNPNTYVSGTRAEMSEWAKAMENTRVYVKNAGAKTVDMGVLDKILSPLAHFDAGEFMDNIATGKMNIDHPFEAMYDRELPTVYSQAHAPTDFVNPEETGFTGWMRTQGRMYYSGRGEGLRDWQGSLARTVDPFETVNTAMSNIANLTSLSDYKLTAVERWVHTYGNFLDAPIGASDLTKFTEGTFKASAEKTPLGSGERIKQQMEAQRDIIRRNLGWQTELDRATNRYTQRIADYVMGDNPNSLQHAFGGKVVNWVEEHNPLNMMRGLAFDLKMGFFNVAQFPLQIQTMLATLAVSPEHAAGALVNLPFMRAYLTKNGGEELLNLAIQRGMHTINGLAPEEYRNMMRMGKNSGFFDFGGTHQMVNSYGPNVVSGGFAQGYDRLRSAGRWFFNEGEVWNRITAWQTAFKDVIGDFKYPEKFNEANLAQFQEEFGRKIALKADDYSMNMMAQSSAMWQKGVLSIPTQFWAYNARMMEAMLGKQFTGAQKMRLFLAQTLFYGAAGAPVVGVVSDLYKKHEGTSLPMDSVAGWFDRGLFDEIAYHATGADVQIGHRYGNGSWMSDMIGEMMGMSPYGEKSFADVVGGATYGIMKDTVTTLADIVNYTVHESGAQDAPLAGEAWTKFAQNASTFSYGQKAFMALQYHAFISNKGTVVASDLPTADAFYFALGIPPGAQDLTGAASGYLKDRKKAVLDATQFYINHRNAMALEPDKRREINEAVNAYSRLIPNDIRYAALQKAQKQMPDTLVHSLSLQVQRDKAQRDMMNKYGQSN